MTLAWKCKKADVALWFSAAAAAACLSLSVCEILPNGPRTVSYKQLASKQESLPKRNSQSENWAETRKFGRRRQNRKQRVREREMNTKKLSPSLPYFPTPLLPQPCGQRKAVRRWKSEWVSEHKPIITNCHLSKLGEKPPSPSPAPAKAANSHSD